MSSEPDSTASRIDSVVASTQEQLDEGRRLVERSKRLSKSRSGKFGFAIRGLPRGGAA